MKKLRKIIALFSVIVIALSLVSCKKYEEHHVCGPDPWEFYPEGYTAGFPEMRRSWNEGARIEIWWVETYDECVEAIELLKSHGSKFDQYSGAISSYEGDLFDVKYCFKIFLSDSTYQTETIQYGDNPFDRKAARIYLYSYVFLDDVTIDEINYGDISDYNVYLISGKAKNLDISNLSTYEFEWSLNEEYQKTYFVHDSSNLSYETIILKSSDQDNCKLISDEEILMLLSSIKKINKYGVFI